MLAFDLRERERERERESERERERERVESLLTDPGLEGGIGVHPHRHFQF